MTLGEKISKLRKENNLTQEELAEILDVTRQSVSRWELDIAFPETDKLLKLCNVFECSVDYLLKNDLLDKNSTSIEPQENSNKKYKVWLYISIGIIISLLIALFLIIGINLKSYNKDDFYVIFEDSNKTNYKLEKLLVRQS